MSTTQIDYISLSVESLRQAENFYARLFDLEVLFRSGPVPGGWVPQPDGATCWEGPDAGPASHRSCLGRDGFRIVLHAAPTAGCAGGRLEHVGVRLPHDQVHAAASRAADLGCDVAHAADCCAEFADPYGVRWRISAMPGPACRKLEARREAAIALLTGCD